MIISNSGTDYKPVPAGTYAACCIRVIDLGTQVSAYNGKAQRKVLFTWEIPEVEVETDDGPMPALISNRYTASLHEKATLRAVLQSWRGKPFTKEELDGYDLKKIVGATSLLGVIHKENFGSGIFTDNTQAKPSRISSPVISTLAFLAISFSSIYLLMTRVIAARKPVKWVPPSDCGMLLVKHNTCSV